MLQSNLIVKQSRAFYSRSHWVKTQIHDQKYTHKIKAMKRRTKRHKPQSLKPVIPFDPFFLYFCPVTLARDGSWGRCPQKNLLPVIIKPLIPVAEWVSDLKTAGTWKMEREKEKLKIHLQKD